MAERRSAARVWEAVRGVRWSEEALARATVIRDRIALQLPSAEDTLARHQAMLEEQRERLERGEAQVARQREELREHRETLADLGAAIAEQLAMRGPLPPPEDLN